MKHVVPGSVPARILHSLAHLQDSLNKMVSPNWRQARCVDDWALAITMESTELIDSYPWKWWKNVKGQVDLQNVKIELADILHFSLSGEMQQRTDYAKGQSDAALNTMRELNFFCSPRENSAAAATTTSMECGQGKESLSSLMFFPLTDTDKAVATFRNIIQLASIHRFDLITKAVIAAAQDLDFNLVAYYVAKFTLNSIRQMKGYKDGTYVKVRDGVEDNVLLHECVAPVSMNDVLDEEKYLATWEGIICRVFDAFGTPQEERVDTYNTLKAFS